MRVLCCGDRNWTDYWKVREEIYNLPQNNLVIIHGCAKGADTIAGQTAKLLGLQVVEFPADWSRYGRAAGPIRNRQMLVEGKPDLVIAFHSDIKSSRGTANMLRQAKRANITTKLVE